MWIFIKLYCDFTENTLSWPSTSSLVDIYPPCFPPFISSVVALSSSSVPTIRRLELSDPSLFLESPCERKYVNNRDIRCFASMPESGIEFPIFNLNNIFWVMSVGAWSKNDSKAEDQECLSQVGPAPRSLCISFVARSKLLTSVQCEITLDLLWTWRSESITIFSIALQSVPSISPDSSSCSLV